MGLRVSSPTFVGRQLELERASAGLDQARAGLPAVFVVAGEAGVGKTRFVEEIADRARSSGMRILEGGCVQLGEEGLPFGPIIEALRRLPDELSPARLDELAGTGRAELARLLPGMRRPVGVAVSADPDPSGPGRLFEQLLLFLNRLALVTPLVLVIEDVHWADRSTLDLLAFLSRNLRAPIVLIATYRADELHRRHPLVPLLTAWERSRRVERVELARFGRLELTEQLAGILGADPGADLVEEIYARSDGNAFFAEELLASRDSGDRVSETLRDVLLDRLATLSEPTQELLRVASAAGRDIDTALLAAVAGTDERALEGPLREAVAGHVLVPDHGRHGEGYAFRHALVREAVYDDLLAGERTRLHAAFAEALAGATESDGGPPRTAELAYHWHAAHDLPRALEASVQAGLAADAMYAYADARANYERALELWDRVPDASSRSPLDRVDLLVRAGITAAGADQARALAYLRSALQLVDPIADPLRAGELLSYLGAMQVLVDDTTALAALREAVRLVPPDPPSGARARVLGALGATLASLDRHRESLAVLEEALAIARATQPGHTASGALEPLGLALTSPRRVESAVLEQLGRNQAALGDVEAGLELIGGSREIARELGIGSRLVEAGHWRTSVLLEAGRLEEAAASGAAESIEAERHGLAGEALAFFEADALFALGHWAEAVTRLALAERLGLQASHRPLIDARQALLDVGRGEFQAAERRLARLRTTANRTIIPTVVSPYASAAAEFALWQGDPLAARGHVEDGLRRIETATEPWVGHVGPLYALGIRAEADLAILARTALPETSAQEGLDIGTDLLARMQRLADEIAAHRPVYTPQAQAWLAVCDSEYQRLHGSIDADSWGRVATMWSVLNMPYPRAYALMHEAQASLSGSGNRGRAAAAILAAFDIASGLGARPMVNRLEGLAGRAGVRLGAVGADPSAPAYPTSGPAGRFHPDRVRRSGDPVGRGSDYLTRRELEVLDLLAAGRSDGEIAGELFISKKTVSVHMANIKGKLGAQSRVEIVTTAIGRGLVDSPPPGT